MSEELTLLPCPLCQARAHVECHNGKFRVICKGESGCPFRMGGKWFVFPDECYDWWNAPPERWSGRTSRRRCLGGTGAGMQREKSGCANSKTLLVAHAFSYAESPNTLFLMS